MNGRSVLACPSPGAELVDLATEARDIGIVAGRGGPARPGGRVALAPAGGRVLGGPGPRSPTIAGAAMACSSVAVGRSATALAEIKAALNQTWNRSFEEACTHEGYAQAACSRR